MKMAKWYEELMELIEEKKDKKAKEILERIELLEQEDEDVLKKEYTEKIKKIEEEIRELDSDPKIKRGLNRKLRKIYSRMNLAVSNQFGQLLRTLREEKGYTLRQLEEMTNVTASYLYRIETGHRKAPSLNIVQRLAEALEVDPLILIEVANDGTKPKQILPLESLLYSSSYLINGKEADVETKKLLVKLIKKASEKPKAGEEMKHAAEVLACLTEYQKKVVE